MSDKLIITPPLVKGDTQRMFNVPQLSENEMLDGFYNFVALNSRLEKLHYLEVIHQVSGLKFNESQYDEVNKFIGFVFKQGQKHAEDKVKNEQQNISVHQILSIAGELANAKHLLRHANLYTPQGSADEKDIEQGLKLIEQSHQELLKLAKNNQQNP